MRLVWGWHLKEATPFGSKGSGVVRRRDEINRGSEFRDEETVVASWSFNWQICIGTELGVRRPAGVLTE